MSSAPPKHWAQIGEAGFIGGMRFLVWVFRYFGRLPFRLALYPVLAWYFLLRPIARRASVNYLQRLQHTHAVFDRPPGLRLAWRHFLSFAEAILDKILALSGALAFGKLAGTAGVRFLRYHLRRPPRPAPHPERGRHGRVPDAERIRPRRRYADGQG